MNEYDELDGKFRDNLIEFDKLQDEYNRLREEEKRNGGYRRNSYERQQSPPPANQGTCGCV